MRHLRLLSLGLFLLGCLRVPPPIDLDAGAPPDAGIAPPLRLESIAVLDRSGASWSLGGAPRRPVLSLRWSTPPEVNEEVEPPVWLLRGEPDDALLEDLASPPLRAANRARIVDATLTRDGVDWRLSSADRIDGGASLTLAVGGWLRSAATGDRIDEPSARRLRVSADPAAGAEVVASWPPDGAPAVSPELPELAIRFDGPIATPPPGSISLREGDHAEEVTLDVVGCAEVGWDEGSCVRLVPARSLRRNSAHLLVIDDTLLDPTGAPVGPWTARFTTAGEPPDEPSPRELTCALDEIMTAIGCALADDAQIIVRIDLGEPARLEWTLGSDPIRVIAPRGAATLVASDLPAATALSGTLSVEGTSGRITTWTVPLRTTEPLARLSIVEVRADPLGPEPTQEYVEVLNYGPVSIDLEGFALADRDDAVGDLLSGMLAAGERALIVSERFDPEEPSDPRVPPGVRLLRVDRSIGAGGLSNAGEPLFLRDAAGRRLSSAPAMSSGGGGICLVREGAPGRGALGFGTADCTPGTP